MKVRTLLLAMASALLVVSPAAAAQQQHNQGSFGGQHGTHQGSPSGHTSQGGHGHGSGQGTRGTGGHQTFPGGNPNWNQYQHRAPNVRTSPHRYKGTVFPTPNRWHGDINRYRHDNWRRGYWRHERHNGTWGWWWVIGPSWYFYNTPVYPYPDSYTPPGEVPGWWYWCEAYQDYYPYVTYCPGGWNRVLPRD